jgi:putative DNA primase/helicase
LIEWEKEQAVLQSVKIKQQISERKTQEKIIEGLRFKAAKIDDAAEQQKMSAEITAKEMALVEIPALPQLFVNDVTPESLNTLLYEQKGRLAIFSDEGGIIETLAGLYSHGAANIDVLLKGIDGGEIRIRRKDKNFVLNPYLTMVLAVQPVIIHNLAKKQAYRGNGTLERFLYVIPKSKLGYRTHNKPPISLELQTAYNQKIKNLLNDFYFSENSENPQTYILKLTPEALECWQTFQSHIEVQLRPHQRLANCLGWGGKVCGFALRIAGLLHIAEYGVKSMELLSEHTLTAFDMMEADETMQDAKAVWQWIKTR